MSSDTRLVLPPELADRQRAAVLRLVAECGLAVRRSDPHVDGRFTVNVCTVCRRGGKLGGHHRPDGTVAHIHKRCHRRIHKASR